MTIKMYYRNRKQKILRILLEPGITENLCILRNVLGYLAMAFWPLRPLHLQSTTECLEQSRHQYEFVTSICLFVAFGSDKLSKTTSCS